MKTFTIVLLVILVILIVACVALYFVGKKAEKKQADQQAQLDAVAQTVSILVIDKGRMKLKMPACRILYSRIHQSIFAVQKYLL